MLAPDVDDSWYRLPDLDITDTTDLSWANQRNYAQGKLSRPGVA